jgi:hypothetical protein
MARPRSMMEIATDNKFNDLIFLRSEIQQKILGSSSSSVQRSTARKYQLMKPLNHERQTDPSATSPLLPQPRHRIGESCDDTGELPPTLAQNVGSSSSSSMDPTVSEYEDNDETNTNQSAISITPPSVRILMDAMDEASPKTLDEYASDGTVSKTSAKVNDDGTIRVPSGSGYRIMTPFPWRLHEILEEVEKKQLDWIVSWLPNGRGFQVHCQKNFSEVIIPMFFRHCRYKSFQRQLYLYGFRSLDTQNMSRGEH